jgi:hypothetical protein
MKVSLCWKRLASVVTAIVMVVGLTVPAGAQTILIDIGSDASYRGASVPNPDGNGNYWNSVWSGAFYQDIVDIGGNATPVDFGFSSATGTDYYNGPSGDIQDPTATVYDAAALGNLGVDEAVYDYYVTSRFEIQQLDPTKTYNLTFYGSHKFNSDPTTVYSVYTDNTYTALVDSASLDVHQPGSPWLHNQDTNATISNLSPQASNILYVDFIGSSGGDGYLNVLQIEEVPGPSPLLGDVNLDGDVNGLDVDPFVDVLLNGPYMLEADMNEDMEVNGLDVDPFVAAVVGGVQPVPEPSIFLLCIVALGVVSGWCRWRRLR